VEALEAATGEQLSACTDLLFGLALAFFRTLVDVAVQGARALTVVVAWIAGCSF